MELHAKPGDQVRAGQPLLTLHTDTPERFARATEALDGAWDIADSSVQPGPLVIDRVSA